jgi:hypothetical protein
MTSVPAIQDSIEMRGSIGGYETGSVATPAIQDSIEMRGSIGGYEPSQITIIEFSDGVDMRVDGVGRLPATAPAPAPRSRFSLSPGVQVCSYSCQVGKMNCAAGCCACDNPDMVVLGSDSSWFWWTLGAVVIGLLALIFIIILLTRR